MQAKEPKHTFNVFKILDLHLYFSTSLPSSYIWLKIFFCPLQVSNLVSLTSEWMLPSLKYPIICLENGQIPWKDSQLSVKTAGIQDEMWLWDNLNIKQEHYPTCLSYNIVFFFLMFLTLIILLPYLQFSCFYNFFSTDPPEMMDVGFTVLSETPNLTHLKLLLLHLFCVHDILQDKTQTRK